MSGISAISGLIFLNLQSRLFLSLSLNSVTLRLQSNTAPVKGWNRGVKNRIKHEHRSQSTNSSIHEAKTFHLNPEARITLQHPLQLLWKQACEGRWS